MNWILNKLREWLVAPSVQRANSEAALADAVRRTRDGFADCYLDLSKRVDSERSELADIRSLVRRIEDDCVRETEALKRRTKNRRAVKLKPNRRKH